ncbi:hypothetical protein [Actinokineospora sp. HUAS TT18]|uniref:hypothetical protein n=1 Tax=Actinokineospora sp. HUAS TT18 TaxID=3447451 RepID=UPI003F52731C
MSQPTRPSWAVAAGAVAAAVTAAVLTTASPAVAANTQYYVDCSAGSNGSGTQASPFNALSAISAITLAAGDGVWFKRGVTCLGQYSVQGSGSSSSGVVIGAYGTGTARPKIDANGAVNAVLLTAVSHVTLQDLELTAPGDGTQTRRGVYAYASNAGTVSNVTLQRLYVHDVRGKMPSTVTPFSGYVGKYANATGGIVVEAAGSATPTRFLGVNILDNDVRSVDRQGIYFWSNWCDTPSHPQGFASGACTEDWYPHEDIVIRDNRLFDIGGDGVVPKTAKDILVEKNKVTGFNRRSNSPNIAFWSANTENATFQYNEASGGKGNLDSQGFDVDHSTVNTVFQYNYSHDNEGGFFLICPVSGNRDFVVRYNLSVNDKERLFQICTGAVTNGQIYNNTIVVGNGLQPKVVYAPDGVNDADITFTNNIIRREDGATLGWTLTDPNIVFDHNAFYNVASHANVTNPVTGTHGLISPPHHDPRASQLLSSSGLHGAGVNIASNGGLDYFGNTVPSSGAPDVGAYQGSGTCAAALSSRFDDTIGSAPPGWTTTGSVVVADYPTATYPGGERGSSVKLTRGATEASMTKSFTGSGDIRASVRIRPDQTTAPLGVFLLDSSGGEVAKATFAASGKVGYTSNGTWYETGPSYATGEWYRLELITHPTTATYDVLLDGKTVVTGAYTGPSDNAATQLKIRSQSGGDSSQTFGVDDVFVRNC